MEDTIEVCAGCGKMPRAIDQEAGFFVCSRCGNRTTLHVTADNYEHVVSDLDRRFHENIIRQKAAAVPREPIPVKKSAAKAAAKKAAKPAAKKKPAKKTRK